MNPNNVERRIKYRKKCLLCYYKSGMLPRKNIFQVPSVTKEDWCKVAGIQKVPSGHLFVCEDHLNLEEDIENFRYWKTMGGNAKLRPESFLSCKTLKSIENLPNVQPSTSSIPSSKEEKHVMACPQVVHKSVMCSPRLEDRFTQCNLKNKTKTFVESIGSESEQYSSARGATTDFSVTASDSTMSEIITKVTVGRQFMLSLIKQKPLNYIRLPKKFYWILDYLEQTVNTTSFHTILVLYKIRNNDSFVNMSDIFEISKSSLWRHFHKTLLKISLFFKQFIYMPSAVEIKNNLPFVFKTNKDFANVHCIIDCFEIEIEKPSNPIDQSLTWSQYKNCNTIKYLISATPDGFINFISTGHGGRISDINLVEQSGFLDILNCNSVLLCDRGFKHLETLFSRKSVKLLRPPSVFSGEKLTKQQAIEAKVIASLRIHIERVIRRIRVFRLLKPHSVINNKLIPYIDECVTVACGLINLQSPIIKNV